MSSKSTDPALQKFFASLSDEFEEASTNRSNRELVPEGQRHCPIRGELMTSAHEKAVLIDVCQTHGIWLDKDELRGIIKHSQDSDLLTKLKARVAEEEEAARARARTGSFSLGFYLGRLG